MPEEKKSLTEVFTDVADAIREKTGSEALIRPLDFADAVDGIVTEQHADYAGPYTVTQNGTLETAGKAMTANLVVDIPVVPEYTGPYTATQNGTLATSGKAMTNDVVVAIPEYQGSYSITQNDTFATTGKLMTNDLVVNVSSSSDPLSQAWAAFKIAHPTDWSFAFCAIQTSNSKQSVLAYADVSYLNFVGSENVTTMVGMFHNNNYLQTIPLFDTSSVTTMSGMFHSCTAITSVPAFNTSSVTNMSSMFYSCTALTSVSAFDTSKVTNMNSMFNSCSSLTSVPAFDTSSVTNMEQMFHNCTTLTSVPAFNTSKVTSMRYMFNNCTALATVPAFNTSSVTNMDSMFYKCPNLEVIHMYGMKINFNISASTKFTREALVEIINNCADLTGGTARTLTMSSFNLNKLTEEDRLIATNKNWTLA